MSPTERETRPDCRPTPPRRLRGAQGPRVLGIAALAGGLLISGCAGSDNHVQTGPPPATHPASATSPSVSASDPTPKTRAAAAAEAQVRRYERMLDDLALNRNVPLDRLYRVSTQPDVTDELAFLGRFRSRGDHQQGRTRITASRVVSIRLPAAAAQHPAVANVNICLDVRSVRATNPAGRSIISKSRKPYYLTHLTLVNRSYPHPDGWLVKKVIAIEKTSCAV